MKCRCEVEPGDGSKELRTELKALKLRNPIRSFRKWAPTLSGTGRAACAVNGADAKGRRWTRHAGVLLSLLLVVWLSSCRNDMHQEPRYDPLAPSTFFADGRSERPSVPGTVARGHLRTDELLYTGMINGQLANVFPFPITRQDLERGRARYNIYCTPCHDYTGSGHGMVVQRGFPLPPSYHIQRLMQAPVGHFFDVMTQGYGTMYSYATRVNVKDRWRIAAYIRALQLSQAATLDDVPPGERQKLLSEKGK